MSPEGIAFMEKHAATLPVTLRADFQIEFLRVVQKERGKACEGMSRELVALKAEVESLRAQVAQKWTSKMRHAARRAQRREALGLGGEAYSKAAREIAKKLREEKNERIKLRDALAKAEDEIVALQDRHGWAKEIADARAKALEEAARLCEAHRDRHRANDKSYWPVLGHAADGIRSLASSPSHQNTQEKRET